MEISFYQSNLQEKAGMGKKPFFFLIMINVSFVPLVNFCMNVTGGLVYSRFG